MFLSLNFAWSSVFIPELWKVHFSFLNFEKINFYTWISSFWKKEFKDKIHVYKQTFSKFKDEKRTFQSSGMKNELHAKFRDKNNSLPKILLTISSKKSILLTVMSFLKRLCMSNCAILYLLNIWCCCHWLQHIDCIADSCFLRFKFLFFF